jgi:sigma-E factor negative regulatory protein RseA
MTQEISSLMDGELGPQEAGKAIQAACGSREALATWQAYHVIGEALRGAQPHPTRCAERVHEALAKEPAIIARPKRVADHVGVRVALAAAASVATIGIVTWIGGHGGSTPAATELAVNTPVKNIQPVNNTQQVASPVDTRLYEGIHRQVPSPDVYTVKNTAPAPR